MAGLSIEQILKSIENMDIYSKDYTIIKDLLDAGDEKFFTKVLEEVLMGNLYWSDFEHILANTKYPDILRDNLKSQKEISEKLRKLIQMRQRLDLNYEYDSANPEETLVLADNYSELPFAENITKLYNSEMNSLRKSILYELTKANPEDTIITKAYKTQLYNALKNGELVKLSNTDEFLSKYDNVEITETEITYGDIVYTEVPSTELNDNDIWCYYEKEYRREKTAPSENRENDPDYDKNDNSVYYRVTEYTTSGPQYYYKTNGFGDRYYATKKYFITDDISYNPEKKYYTASQKKFEYINPDDIFLFITKGIIPIDASVQTINEFDRIFMAQNNIDEKTMKQTKMVSLLLKKKEALNLLIEGENYENI